MLGTPVKVRFQSSTGERGTVFSASFLTFYVEKEVHNRLREDYDNSIVPCGDCWRRHREIFVIPGEEEDVHEMLEEIIVKVDQELRAEFGS
jgi:hypothetical protein